MVGKSTCTPLLRSVITNIVSKLVCLLSSNLVLLMATVQGGAGHSKQAHPAPASGLCLSNIQCSTAVDARVVNISALRAFDHIFAAKKAHMVGPRKPTKLYCKLDTRDNSLLREGPKRATATMLRKSNIRWLDIWTLVNRNSAMATLMLQFFQITVP